VGFLLAAERQRDSCLLRSGSGIPAYSCRRRRDGPALRGRVALEQRHAAAAGAARARRGGSINLRHSAHARARTRALGAAAAAAAARRGHPAGTSDTFIRPSTRARLFVCCRSSTRRSTCWRRRCCSRSSCGGSSRCLTYAAPPSSAPSRHGRPHLSRAHPAHICAWAHPLPSLSLARPAASLPAAPLHFSGRCARAPCFREGSSAKAACLDAKRPAGRRDSLDSFIRRRTDERLTRANRCSARSSARRRRRASCRRYS
jgi:hypothetical protein